MNVVVALVTCLLAAVCGAPLLLADARGTARRNRLDTDGHIVDGVVNNVQAAGGKRLLTVVLDGGSPLTVRVTTDEKFRKGATVRMRILSSDSSVGELENDPLKPMGRAVAYTVIISILLLGLTLALLS